MMLFERVCHRLLVEYSQPSTQGLAASVTRKPGYRDAIVYDMEKMRAILDSLDEKMTPDQIRSIKLTQLHNVLGSAVIATAGIIRPDPMRGTFKWEVCGTAGPGSMAYGLVSALSGPDGVVPDRASVSSLARDAWTKVGPSRQRLPLDDLTAHKKGQFDHPGHTQTLDDDGRLWGPDKGGDYLDYIYFPAGWEEDFLATMEESHRLFKEEFVGRPQLYLLEDSQMKMLGAFFFDANYLVKGDKGPSADWV